MSDIDNFFDKSSVDNTPHQNLDLFRENVDKLEEAVEEGNVPVVELRDDSIRQIVVAFSDIVNKMMIDTRSEYQELVRGNQEILEKLMLQIQTQQKYVQPAAALAAEPPPPPPAAAEPAAVAPPSTQKLKQSLKAPLEQQNFETLQKRSVEILSDNTELLQLIGQSIEMDRELHTDVPEEVHSNLQISRNLEKQLNIMFNKINIMSDEIINIKRDIQTANVQQIEQGQKIQEGVVQANEGIGRVEVAVGDINQNVTEMRGQVRERFDQAAAQVREFRDFAAQRFDDVIRDINRIGTYDSPCELKYNEGYGVFFNSLVWCIFVFCRFLTKILAFIREVYFEFKQRFLSLLPENLVGVPIRWLFEMAFAIMEWGAVLLILDKYIGPLIGIPDLANKFIIKSGFFIYELFKYVYEIIFQVWNTLTSPIKKVIVKLCNIIGLWDWLVNIGSLIYDFFKKILVDSISEALPSVPDVGLYSALGWRKGGKGKGKGKKSNGGADIPPHLIRWIKTAQKNNYLDIINISSLLNEAVFYNAINYITNLQLGIIDPTFISFLSTHPENILAFQKNANHLYYLLKDNGIFEMTPRIRESSRVEMLSGGRKRTHRGFYKYKKNSSRKVVNKKTKKNRRKNKKFNKLKSKKNYK